jgi:hypothetical protein
MHENGALRSAYAETDLQLNPQHPAYKGGAVQRLITAAQDYLAANAGPHEYPSGLQPGEI